MQKAKPVVNIATACEKILVEKDDVISILRVVDIFYIPEAANALPDAGIQVSGLIVLRGGDFVGEGEVSVVIVKPDGTRSDPQVFPMLFGAANQANSVVCQMAVAAKNLGMSWVEVLWNGEILTKFPIKLERQPKPGEQFSRS